MMMAAMAQAPQQQQTNWDQEFSKVAEQDVKGKGKAVDDLEEAFKQLSADDKPEATVQEKPQSQHPDYMSDFEKQVNARHTQPWLN